jgi:hypothetical protein
MILVPIAFIWAASFFVSMYTGKKKEGASNNRATRADGPGNAGDNMSDDEANRRAADGDKLGRRRTSLTMEGIALAVAAARQTVTQQVTAIMNKTNEKKSHGALSTKLKILISVCQVLNMLFYSLISILSRSSTVYVFTL